MPDIATHTWRRLPHWQPAGRGIFITWRLHGSLPKHIPLFNEKNIASGEAFVRHDHILDQAQTGPLWLNDSRIAGCVISRLFQLNQRQLYSLRAYVLMANHVHILIEPHSPLAQITQLIKGATAREANLMIGRTGAPFWQNESFDHWVRDPGEWQKIRNYIERNPVAAGLVQNPEDWPWSSASHPIK